MNLNTVPFLGPHAQLSRRTKEKHFHGPIFGTVWRYQKWDRKIAKSTAKADPCNKQKLQLRLFKQPAYIELEQRRPAHAKPDFNWLSGPKNGTWKRTCGISCLRSLAPMWRFAMQHHPGNMHQSFATPRYSATPCYVLIQLPNVIDTISKRWRSKKAFNTSPCHIFS